MRRKSPDWIGWVTQRFEGFCQVEEISSSSVAPGSSDTNDQRAIHWLVQSPSITTLLHPLQGSLKKKSSAAVEASELARR